MDAILTIDVGRRTAMVEPGVLNGDRARGGGARGLWYPPDPASRDISTLGGNLASLTRKVGVACRSG